MSNCAGMAATVFVPSDPPTAAVPLVGGLSRGAGQAQAEARLRLSLTTGAGALGRVGVACPRVAPPPAAGRSRGRTGAAAPVPTQAGTAGLDPFPGNRGPAPASWYASSGSGLLRLRGINIVRMGGIVGLGGGTGASRLWRALAGPARGQLTLVVNTADSLWQHGLRICPDLDTVLYALSGRLDPERGWGIRNDSFRCMAALAGAGGESWFRLGDLDLATHLYRTGLLRDGGTLTGVTRRLAGSHHIPARLLPMTDDDVTATIVTADGRRLHYEEYLVRERAAPAVRGVAFEGIGGAVPAPGVLAAIETAWPDCARPERSGRRPAAHPGAARRDRGAAEAPEPRHGRFAHRGQCGDQRPRSEPPQPEPGCAAGRGEPARDRGRGGPAVPGRLLPVRLRPGRS